jgi:uncharacterized membrane protein
MEKNRLEAFSDGVLAIIITIMVLELKVPHVDSWGVLLDRWPVFLSYVISFLYVGSYWNNHHHLFQAARKVSGGILWANLHLLFWLSLVPFTTGWMGENHFSRTPTILYGANLLMCALAYYLLQVAVAKLHGPNHPISQALGHDIKGKISLLLYLIGIALAQFVSANFAFALFAATFFIWLIPDRRMESAIEHHKSKAQG